MIADMFPPQDNDFPPHLIRKLRRLVPDGAPIDEAAIRTLTPAMDRIIARLDRAEAQRQHEIETAEFEPAA